MQQSVEGWPSVWQLCPSLGSVRNALVQEKSLLAFFAAGHLNLQQTAKSEVRYPSVRKAAGLATERSKGTRNQRCPFSGTAPQAAGVVDPAEEAEKEMSCVPGCAATICLLFPLWLDWLSATFLQECFG